MTFHLTDTTAGVLSRQDSFMTVTEDGLTHRPTPRDPEAAAASEHSPLLARAEGSSTPNDDASTSGLPRPSTDSKRR